MKKKKKTYTNNKVSHKKETAAPEGTCKTCSSGKTILERSMEWGWRSITLAIQVINLFKDDGGGQ
ncbi:hypothetical protein [Paenibacillus elgii]|uniref:hypothetical protein n=1 Tax=Paenibacillus elgii TaxID=189691 RepID=UPI000FD633BD|nr:hypothetical protein [Paenibacillus elgii]NEN84611.1 hypothetical protein [Paenibacillus elgii]